MDRPRKSGIGLFLSFFLVSLTNKLLIIVTPAPESDSSDRNNKWIFF